MTQPDGEIGLVPGDHRWDDAQMHRPAEEIDAGPVVLRRWRAAWAGELVAAVRASLPELQAFMAWAGDDYAIENARVFRGRSDRDWTEGTEFGYAVQTPEGRVVGAASLMTRMGPGVLEIGYWIHSGYTGRGFATAATVALARAALALDGIGTIALRHDAANHGSRRVAEKAGFTEVARRPSTLDPGRDASGLEVVWELRRA